MQTVKTDEWPLYPMYSGKCISRIRVGRVAPEVKPEWLATSILEGTEEDTEII